MRKTILAMLMAGLMLITVFSVCFTASAATEESTGVTIIDNSNNDSLSYSSDELTDVILLDDYEGDRVDDSISEKGEMLFIYLDAGKDIITYAGQPTVFKLNAFCPAGDEIEYAWDFNGDGIYDFLNRGDPGQIVEATHIYKKLGAYTVTIKVTDPNRDNSASYSYINVYVGAGSGDQRYVKESEEKTEAIKPQSTLPPDDITEKYAVMINGGYEECFWIDVVFTYQMLIEDYDFTPDHIYLLNYDGKNPDGENPGNMIDFAATKSNIKQVFNTLAGIIDEDDILFVWIDDHGGGYYGPDHEYYGYSYSPIEVDPGDEHDYLESDFKLRSFYTGNNFHCNHGMDIWKVGYDTRTFVGEMVKGYKVRRIKYVSKFIDVFIEEKDTTVSDNDIFIEKFEDYLAGDYNRNGIIEDNSEETFDFDGDGVWPFDNTTGEILDEDDWGAIDRYKDDVTYLDTKVPSGENYIIFDDGLDNHVDIDVDTTFYEDGKLEVDGTDLDNQGLFDGIDVNDDGDMDDWVSIDEFICLYYGQLYDDELKSYMDLVNPAVTIVFLAPCFSGGFIWDLSAPNRVICSQTVEESLAYNSFFLRGFTSALHRSDLDGNPIDADYDKDGNISIMEAFNYATENDPIYPEWEIPQYDDNGDGVGHPYKIPNGGDGELGSKTFLDKCYVSQDDIDNQPPDKPTKPSGMTSGKINVEYTYTTSAFDPDGDQVYYWFDWDDGTTSGWIGPFDSGEIVTAKHKWDAERTYDIRVKAKDIHDAESEWSNPLSVTLPVIYEPEKLTAKIKASPRTITRTNHWVTFDARESLPETGGKKPIWVRWDFDGSGWDTGWRLFIFHKKKLKNMSYLFNDDDNNNNPVVTANNGPAGADSSQIAKKYYFARVQIKNIFGEISTASKQICIDYTSDNDNSDSLEETIVEEQLETTDEQTNTNKNENTLVETIITTPTEPITPEVPNEPVTPTPVTPAPVTPINPVDPVDPVDPIDPVYPTPTPVNPEEPKPTESTSSSTSSSIESNVIVDQSSTATSSISPAVSSTRSILPELIR